MLLAVAKHPSLLPQTRQTCKTNPAARKLTTPDGLNLENTEPYYPKSVKPRQQALQQEDDGALLPQHRHTCHGFRV